MSCSDETDEIFCGSANQPLLRNKDRICEHGEGLHPLNVRLGILFNKQAYNAYSSLLCGEKEFMNNGTLPKENNRPVVTAYLITTKT